MAQSSDIVVLYPEPLGGAEKAPLLDASLSVGVFGWLGFVIINIAAWGIIITADAFIWTYGFGTCTLYTAGLMALALALERRDLNKYRHFINLLWVLAAIHIFILGLYLSIHVVGPNDTDMEAAQAPQMGSDRRDLTQFLPSNASADLRAWAREPGVQQGGPDFVAFGGGVFFSGIGKRDTSTAYLRQTTGSATMKVTPPLMGATSFTKFRSALFFLASTEGAGDALWRIGSDDLGHASLVQGLEPGPGRGSARGLVLDRESSSLYVRVDYECPSTECYAWVSTIFRSDGTAAGTADLSHEDPCLSACAAARHHHGRPREFLSRAALWGVLFLATLPMMALAAFVVAAKQLPGPVFNLFCGGIAAAVVMYWLTTYNSDHNGFPSFLKWFLTIYTSVLWLSLLLWAVARPTVQAAWLEDLKTWAVALVSLTFFMILHADLEIPRTSDVWPWAVYAFVIVLQIVCSMVVSRSIPLVLSAIGLFLSAAKIATEVVNLFSFSHGMSTLVWMLVLAVQGMGIVAAAILWQTHRDKVDGSIAALVVNVRRQLFSAVNK